QSIRLLIEGSLVRAQPGEQTKAPSSQGRGLRYPLRATDRGFRGPSVEPDRVPGVRWEQLNTQPGWCVREGIRILEFRSLRRRRLLRREGSAAAGSGDRRRRR